MADGDRPDVGVGDVVEERAGRRRVRAEVVDAGVVLAAVAIDGEAEELALAAAAPGAGSRCG